MSKKLKPHTAITISPARHEDCKAIAELGRKVWGGWANGMPLPVQIIELEHPVFVAKDSSGNLLGYAIGLVQAYGKTGHVLSITIAENNRRFGLGEKLINSLLHVFFSQGTSKVTAIVSKENPASRSLFTKLGFESGSEILDYYEPGEIVFRYTLSK